MKTYKLKSLAYLSCFIIAAVIYYNVESDSQDSVAVEQETLAEADLGQLSTTEFENVEDLEQ